MLQYVLTKFRGITILYRVMFVSKPNFILILVLYIANLYDSFQKMIHNGSKQVEGIEF
jgi:hypothetical protein